MTVRIKTTALSLHQKATRDDYMGLVKTRRLMAMQKQQRAKAGMRMKALPKGPFSFQPSANKMRDAKSGKLAPSAPRPSKHA